MLGDLGDLGALLISAGGIVYLSNIIGLIDKVLNVIIKWRTVSGKNDTLIEVLEHIKKVYKPDMFGIIDVEDDKIIVVLDMLESRILSSLLAGVDTNNYMDTFSTLMLNRQLSVRKVYECSDEPLKHLLQSKFIISCYAVCILNQENEVRATLTIGYQKEQQITKPQLNAISELINAVPYSLPDFKNQKQ